MLPRQDLERLGEQLEREGKEPTPLLSPEEGAALVQKGKRAVGVLTYGWLMKGDPDPGA